MTSRLIQPPCKATSLASLVKFSLVVAVTLQLFAAPALVGQTAAAADICSTSYNRVLKNGAVGGLAGGAVGALLNGESRTRGAVTGALIGAAGGAGYGYYREYQRKKDVNCSAQQTSNQPVYNSGYYNNGYYNTGSYQDPYYTDPYAQNTYTQNPYYSQSTPANQSSQSSSVLGSLLGGLF
ncbi:MAG: hypothetical protein KC476_07550 [Cyanobacteria bacterium HKST-UBA06]|nr:hypothetical protein [Cyanobacteria bacterium HKST-UBA06]